MSSASLKWEKGQQRETALLARLSEAADVADFVQGLILLRQYALNLSLPFSPTFETEVKATVMKKFRAFQRAGEWNQASAEVYLSALQALLARRESVAQGTSPLPPSAINEHPQLAVFRNALASDVDAAEAGLPNRVPTNADLRALAEFYDGEEPLPSPSHSQDPTPRDTPYDDHTNPERSLPEYLSTLSSPVAPEGPNASHITPQQPVAKTLSARLMELLRQSKAIVLLYVCVCLLQVLMLYIAYLPLAIPFLIVGLGIFCCGCCLGPRPRYAAVHVMRCRSCCRVGLGLILCVGCALGIAFSWATVLMQSEYRPFNCDPGFAAGLPSTPLYEFETAGVTMNVSMVWRQHVPTFGSGWNYVSVVPLIDVDQPTIAILWYGCSGTTLDDLYACESLWTKGVPRHALNYGYLTPDSAQLAVFFQYPFIGWDPFIPCVVESGAYFNLSTVSVPVVFGDPTVDTITINLDEDTHIMPLVVRGISDPHTDEVLLAPKRLLADRFWQALWLAALLPHVAMFVLISKYVYKALR